MVANIVDGEFCVVLADDHALFREGLRREIQQLSPQVQLHEAADFDALLELSASIPPPRLVLMDLDMPGQNWQTVLPQLRERWGSETALVLLTASESAHDIHAAFALDIDGYIPKSSTVNVFLAAVRLVLSGGQYMPANLVLEPREADDHLAKPPPQKALSPRQRQILQLIAKGYSNKEIARELDLSIATVKVHVVGLLRAINARNRSEAAALAESILDDDTD